MKLQKTVKCILICCLTAVLLVSATGCNLLPDPSGRRNSVTIDDLMLKQENQNGAGQTITAMGSMKGVPSAISGKLLITVDEMLSGSVYRVYNMETRKELARVSDTRKVGFLSSLLTDGTNIEGIYYIINENVMYIYNSDGTQAIASYYSVDGSYPLEDTLNGFSFNGTEYYVRDGMVIYEGDNPLESEFFNASVEYNGNHYYIENEEAIFVFDPMGKTLYEFHRPSYAENAHIFVLGNGNVFIQYTYETVAGEAYDYILEGKQHKIVSILANIARGTVTEPVVDFLVVTIENAFTNDDFHTRYTERVNNVAQIVDIANKRIDENAPARYIILSDSLIELFSMQDVINGALDIIRISYDRNLVRTAAGSLLVAGDCTVIGQINNYRAITEKFIMTSGKIYDHDLNALFDLTASGYTYHDCVGDNIILTKVVDDTARLYLYTGSDFTYISDMANYISCFEGYAVSDGSSYRYFDENGKLLATTYESINWIYSDVDIAHATHVGYAHTAEGDIEYYQLDFTPVDSLK
ncbi:MAG: hypothetical protein IJW46_07130 [Clostridia bacterium]|nr:hypothetical protein [Clostridia bacterium]